MKKKRIHFNEINEEIYTPKIWTKGRIILVSIILLILGFFANFSLEEKINKGLLALLQKNDGCPVQFQKAELSYFLPKVKIKSLTVPGNCFGQPGQTLLIREIILSLHSPSFYPLGIRFHLSLKEGATDVHLYPTLSFFSHYLEIDKTKIDAKFFNFLNSDGKSPIGGTIDVAGFLKFTTGNITDGQLSLTSKNFHLPAQNFRGFNLSLMSLSKLSIKAHFSTPGTMQVDEIKIGQSNAPIEINLKGKINVSQNNFGNSQLSLKGNINLSQFLLNNYSFIKIFFPPNNTTGKYQMSLDGPLNNLGPPIFN